LEVDAVKKLGRAFLVLTAGLLPGLALVTSATGTTVRGASRIKHISNPIAAFALDGNRVAYGIHPASSLDRVDVWDFSTGKTTTVSGIRTQEDGFSPQGIGVYQVAIAGTRVAWLTSVGGKAGGHDYVFASSATKPKERLVDTEDHLGGTCVGDFTKGCAGNWLGGVVGSGSLIALNRWTTDSQGTITTGGLYALKGTRMSKFASGSDTVEAAVASGSRVAVLRQDGSVGVYSSSGKSLLNLPLAGGKGLALNGRNLLVLTKPRTLQLYDAKTGARVRTFTPRGTVAPRNLDVQGKTALYTTGSAVHLVNLSSGKDRVFAEHRGGVLFAALDRAGLVYGGNGYGSKGTLIFVPFARVAAAVG
jgi:hypothetical protein